MSAEQGDPVEVRAGTDDDLSTCLDVLNRSFDTTRFTQEWFDWKHRSCPFGSSRMWLADSEDGVVGLFFALPWHYRADEHRVAGVRTVDGATLPAARGRRVLGTLIRHEYEQWGPGVRPGVLVATATETARRSHVKNGALALPPLRYAYCLPPIRRPARIHAGDSVLDGFVSVDHPGMGTDWSPEALRWRTDQRSGNAYDAASLRESDTPNGLVYRINDSRGLRTVVPLVSWGTTQTQRRLLSSVAAHARSPVLITPIDEGAAPLPVRRVRDAGHAWVCVWDRRVDPAAQDRSPLGRLTGWSLGYGELEGLI